MIEDKKILYTWRIWLMMYVCTSFSAKNCAKFTWDSISHDYDHHSERGSKNPKPEFSRINGGGSTSAMSTFCIDLEMSSTENGMLHWLFRLSMTHCQFVLGRQWIECLRFKAINCLHPSILRHWDHKLSSWIKMEKTMNFVER